MRRAVWVALFGALLALITRACQFSTDCPVPPFCAGVAHCNVVRGTCEIWPRCVNPALPYCNGATNTCVAKRPQPSVPPPLSSSELIDAAFTGCTTAACCVSQIRAAYRYTLLPASRLPWCILAVQVAQAGSGCEIVSRCPPSDFCNATSRSCLSGGGVRTAQTDVALCITDADCDSSNYCQGQWTCGPRGTCVAPSHGPCYGNTSYPLCDADTLTCVRAPTFGIGFPIWVIVVVCAIILCFILCTVVLCSIGVSRGYTIVEYSQAGYGPQPLPEAAYPPEAQIPSPVPETPAVVTTGAALRSALVGGARHVDSRGIAFKLKQ
jgi:hypothetical protein